MILTVFGTRPEWLKIRPVVDTMEECGIPFRILFTGQHEDIIDSSLDDYVISTLEINNDICKNRLDSIVCSIMSQIDNHLEGISHVLIQGDTTTVFATALAAYHRNIPVIHLEAGLRTWDNKNPYPEEFNRQATGCIADIHLCPTDTARSNLWESGIQGNTSSIHVVGNTVLDNIVDFKFDYKMRTGNDLMALKKDKILVTLHRRENHKNIKKWFKQIDKLAKKYSQYEWVLPVHPNPNVLRHAEKLKYVTVVDPLEHERLLELLCSCRIVITDSGGIQEEAAFLRVPCIVCRKKTERTEGVGSFSFFATEPKFLKDRFKELKNYKIDEKLPCPYGDGNSAIKVVRIIEQELGLNNKKYTEK